MELCKETLQRSLSEGLKRRGSERGAQTTGEVVSSYAMERLGYMDAIP
jgi:hypothetical protein